MCYINTCNTCEEDKEGLFDKRKDRGSKQEESWSPAPGSQTREMKYTEDRTLLKETELPVRVKPTVRNNIKPDTQTVLLHGVRSPGKEFVYQVFLYVPQNKPQAILCRLFLASSSMHVNFCKCF